MTEERIDVILEETKNLELLIKDLYCGTKEFTKENYSKLMKSISSINYEVCRADRRKKK